MATSNDIKNGSVLNLDGNLWTIIDFQHVKPGKGGAFVRTKMKNVMSGKVVDKTFNAGAKVEFETVDRRDMQYLYNDGTDYIFMDPDTFDQVIITPTDLGDAKDYLLENEKVMIATHNGNPLFVELPASVVLEVTYTEPGLQGDRSTWRHQARDARDRQGDPGSPVPRGGHQGQGQHEHRRLPRPRERLDGSPHQGAQEAPSTSCSRRTSGARTSRTSSRSASHSPGARRPCRNTASTSSAASSTSG